MSESRIQIIRRILRICFQRPVCMAVSVLLAALSSLAYFVPYLAIYRLLQALLLTGSIPVGSAVLRYGLIAFAGAAANVLCYFASLILSHIAAFQTSYGLRITLADKFSRLPLGFHIREGVGKQFRLMDAGVDKIQSFIAHKLPDMVSSVVYPVTMVALILSIDWRFGLAMAIGIAIAYLFHYLSMGRGGAKHMMELYYGALDDMENAAVECVRGVTVLKTFSRSAGAYRKLQDAIGDYTDMVIPYTRNWERYMPAFSTLIANIYLFLIPAALWCAPDAAHWAEFAVSFLFYLILAPSLASVIPKIGRIMEEFMRVYTEVERFDTVMETPDLPQSDKEPPIADASLRFSNVCFSYTGDNAVPALSGISFTAAPGQVTAIVGPSGSGKSTIASLIARFWDPDAGQITLGGADIRNMPMETLMSQIAFVLQNDRLFSQSILENIRFGNKTASTEAVIEAAKAANCHDFITRLPDGYETVLGAEGVHLSAGQRQRITLARAFLKDAPIIVLDEATASQDAENEAAIQQAISRLICGKTVLLIAHRLSTVQNADQILVMKHGQIHARGTHANLMENAAFYRGLWNAYSATQAWHLERAQDGGAK